MTFEIVDDELRNAPGVTSKYGPAIAVLLDNQTIFVPGVSADKAAGYYAAAKRVGRKLHAKTIERDGVRGSVMWLD